MDIITLIQVLVSGLFNAQGGVFRTLRPVLNL